MRTRLAHGFTLIELSVTVAIVAILAAVAYGLSRNAVINVNVSGAAYELALRVNGLRSTAMSENADYLLVVADAQDNDATGCSWSARAKCVEVFVLRNPASDWSLSSFDPASPAAKADFVESLTFGRNVAFDLASSPAFPAPFSATAIPPRDSDLTATCTGNRKCFALRFRSRGEVAPEYAGSTQPRKLGYAFVLGSSSQGSELRALVVSFPTGIVKSLAF